MSTATFGHGVQGWVAPGWDAVADTFAAAFARGEESGAAVCVYRDGRPVVDLWGGVADGASGERWERGTVVPVFSTSKGVVALLVHLLVEQGVLDLDLPVAHYWPEFGAAGKQACTVRWLLTHQAGLPSLDADLTFEDVRAVDPVLRALEAQVPRWEPGTRVAYHAMTYGHLLGEVVRRATGRTIGAVLRDELVTPLGLQMWLGLPPEAPVHLARLEQQGHPVGGGPVRLLHALAARLPGLSGLLDRATRGITLGGAFPLRLADEGPGNFNDRATLGVELPAAGVVTDARSLARLYAAVVGAVDGAPLLPAERVAALAAYRVTTPVHGLPRALGNRINERQPTGLGFVLPCRLGPTSLGHWGAGGSLGLADLECGVGFGYVMNRMLPDATARSGPLLDAVRRCLGAS